MAEPEPLVVADVEVAPGTRVNVSIPVARRIVSGDVVIPASVVRGKRDGPRLFVSAAIHGDEILGTEIVRRLLRMPLMNRIRGSLIAVPIVNVYGFVLHSRYLPDRRDLNRSFPGSAKGSLAARLASTFVREVVMKSTHGIDLHTGSLHRENLPQLRATLDSEEVNDMARAFGAPVIMDAMLREGSLRQTAHDNGIPIIVYEAGEALRFNELAIRAGLNGVISVMREIGMLPASRKAPSDRTPYVANGSSWVRASETGILVSKLKLGAQVAKGDELCSISDPLGEDKTPVLAPTSGVLIGRTNLPLVNEGDALFHIATFGELSDVADDVVVFHEEFDANPELL